MRTLIDTRSGSRHGMPRALLPCGVLPLCLALSLAWDASAADTWETYNVGPSEIELYTGLDGIGLHSADRSVFLEGLVGWGFVDGFSGYVITGLGADGAFGHREGWVYLGMFGTPLDTDHVDLDLFIDFGIVSGGLELTPGLELNLDIKPDQELAGFYLFAGETLGFEGGKLWDDPWTPGIDESGSSWSMAPGLGLTAGFYWTAAESHQLLLEYDMGIAQGSLDGESRVDVGGLALGWNACLTDMLELITQVHVDLPQQGERPAVGFMLGLILIPPSAAGEG